MNFQQDSLDKYIINNLFLNNSFDNYFQSLKKQNDELIKKEQFDFKIQENVEKNKKEQKTVKIPNAKIYKKNI